jgi:hypothetical protein
MCKLNKITSIIIAAVSSTIIAIGVGVGIYFYSNHNHIQLNLKGISGTNTIFLDLNDNKVSYDIIKESTNNPNYYLLNRFFNLNSEFILAETLLDHNYIQISNWDYLDTDLETNDVVVKKEINILNIDISNIMFDITYVDNNPIKINEYDIVKYNLGGKINDTVYSYLQNIKNPTLDELIKTNHTSLSVTPPYIDPKCLIELSYKAMTSGKQQVALGKCGGYNTVGIPGTDFNDIEDIIANIKGALYDNFKTGFDNLKNFDRTKKYDVCTGYSLGGGIAKYMSLNNYCKNVITFASPLTMKYNINIPIIQYINTIDDFDGCCKRNWLGKCVKKGMFLADPVTLILKGNHQNIKYIGKRQNNDCVGNFAYTVWKKGFDLHLISSYENNFFIN